MPTYTVHAYGFAATFKLRDLVPLFSTDEGQVRVKERLIAPIGEGRWALAYDFGAVVFVGLDEAEESRVIKELSARLSGEPHPPLTEKFLIELAPGAPTEVRFDRVVVPELTVDVVDIVALILAQSVAMDYYARDVDQIEVETDRIA